MTKNSSSSRAPQLRLALNSGTTRRSAKMAKKAEKPPSLPSQSSSADELNLRHLNLHDDLHNRDIVHLVRALQLRNLHSFLLCPDPAPVVVQQRASSTLSKNCSCGISPVFCTVCTVGTRRWSITEKSTTLSMNWIWGTSTSSYTMDCWNLSLMITAGAAPDGCNN